MQIEKREDKCIECMLCVRDCVMGVWRIVDGKSRPVETELCNRCSHCIAICPCDAVIHDGLGQGDIAAVNRKNLRPDVYRDIIISRRSVRRFKNEPVPGAMIENIIDLARYAPSASNSQNVGYIIITDKRLIESTAAGLFRLGNRLYNATKKGIGRFFVNLTGLSKNRYLKVMDYVQEQNAQTGRDFVLHNAPVLILIHAPERQPFASDNCNIAAATMINYAHALGLGTCFVGILTLALRLNGRLRKKLGVPQKERVYAALVMGYPQHRYTNTVSRKNPEVKWL